MDSAELQSRDTTSPKETVLLMTEHRALIAELEDLLELPGQTLKASDNLAALPAWDSLAVITFIAWADELHSVTIQASEIAAARTVGELLSLVRSDRE